MEYQISKITNAQLDKLAIESGLPMNSLRISMPYPYISKLINLNWHDVLFAVENGFLSHQATVEHAMIELENNENYPQAVLDLACLSPEEAMYPHSIHPYIDDLANIESEDKKSATNDKIMYAVLNWVFEHKECYEDPLKVVEFIYDDFDFPKSIDSFVRYKPSAQPLLGTVEANIERLFNNWKDFLNEQKAKYSV